MLSVNVGPFAVQAAHLILLMSLVLAVLVGHVVGRRNGVGIGDTVLDMLVAGLVAARVAFVIEWFDSYRDQWLDMIDIRDGGFTPWAGIATGLAVGAWRAWQRPALRDALGFGVAAGLAAWFFAGGPAGPDPGKAARMPQVGLVTLDGQPASLPAIAAGRPLVLNLWASWCPPCRREMPVLARAQAASGDVAFVFANQGEDAATAQRYLAADRLVLQNVLLDPRAATGKAIGSSALPVTLFYDSRARLVDTHMGALSAASLASKLARLRAAPTEGK